MSAILLAHCPDRPGLVAEVAHWVQARGGNVLELEQHVATDEGRFFLRALWELDGGAESLDVARTQFESDVAAGASMQWRLFDGRERPRVAVFVSKLSHCLFDLVARAHAGEFPADLALVVSNHETLRPIAERFGLPFAHVPVRAATKPEAEAEQRRLLREHRCDLVVLARYMQILSPAFVEAWAGRIINIHHSFLPAFPGAKPYHQAYDRGVKVIGATSHYVTAILDDGPIIAQDVVRVSHRDAAADLVRKGRDIERLVLARAVRAHLERRVLTVGKRTVVFGEA